MSATLAVRDKTTFAFGGEERVFTLDFPTERVTVRELIRTRIYEKVEGHNARHGKLFRVFVQPPDAEWARNVSKATR